ncbi:MAG: RES family NAD+ phosphorylase [Chitinophagaceae bacterium]
MEVFRIVQAQYAKSFNASGCANRWNKKDEWVLYAGASRSLASLELLVHQGQALPKPDSCVMVISIPDDAAFMSSINPKQLPANWRSLNAYPILQKLGSQWYQAQSTLVLKIPSVIIPNEFNYAINTKHPDFKKHIKKVRIESFFWDERL